MLAWRHAAKERLLGDVLGRGPVTEELVGQADGTGGVADHEGARRVGVTSRKAGQQHFVGRVHHHLLRMKPARRLPAIRVPHSDVLRNMIPRTLFRPALAVGALALLAACGSSSNTTNAAGSATTAVATTAAAATTTAAGGANPYVPPTSGAAAASTGMSLSVATDAKFGQILVDSTGMSLYLFEKDQGTTTACTGKCVAAWPAATVSGSPTVGTGVDQSKVSTVKRSDGAEQLAYNGHLLYRFAGDHTAGETNGQDFGGIWYLVNPAGSSVES